MQNVVDLDDGTLRRVDWRTLAPGTILISAFSTTFNVSFLTFGACALAFFSAFERPETFVFDLTRRLAIGITSIGFALAVARFAAVRLATGSRLSAARALKFAALKFTTLLLPIFLPTSIYYSAFEFVAVLRLTSGTIFEFVAVPFAAVAFLFLAVSFAITFFSLPLSAAAVATEGKNDGFDVILRGVSYLTQRPFHCLAYSALAAFLTFVGLALIIVFSKATIFFYAQIGFSSTAWARFWYDFLTLIPTAYLGICGAVYSTAIYFALRRSVDGTPLNAVGLEST